MPPKNSAKRKTGSSSAASGSCSKKRRADAPDESTDPLRRPHPLHEVAEEHGIVLREFYPPEMSTERARAYTAGRLPRPIDELNSALAETAQTRRAVKVQDAVVHWFKMDLRVSDNKGLSLASAKAKAAGVALIGLYVVSPQDWEAHLRAPVRVDFMLRSLQVLKKDLAKLDIPFHIETVEKRWDVPGRILNLMTEWGAKHLVANIEYEVDELRREAKLVRMAAERGIAVEVAHDTCVVPPGALQSGSGNQYAVYSPWYKAWLRHLRENPELLEVFESPAQNPSSARDQFGALFGSKVPEAPAGKRLSKEEAKKFRSIWPAGEHEAKTRLEAFCYEMIGRYHSNRNIPALEGTSSVSVHLASGTLSARTCIRTASDCNSTRKLDGGSEGVQTWISEVAWRDFYRHILVNWPYVCMNKPFKPEFAGIEWSYDESLFQAWREGRTGYPLVDAAMRQLAATGWMHNRCRMVVASFLAKDLLLDWRLGERHFMLHLVDGDFASNSGGWGFSAGVGVDPQPYFRVFNPLLQSEKFDPDGEYVRRWVPELGGIGGRAVHDPYGRGAGEEARRAGYPEPIVEHKGSRERALSVYKAGIAKNM